VQPKFCILNLFVLASLAFSPFANADTDDIAANCSDIRLDQAPGAAMTELDSRIPHIAQVANDCSFYTATQLYDAWRFRYHEDHLDQLSSAFEAYVRMQEKQGKTDLETGGNVPANLKMLRGEGSCPRRYYNSTTGQDDDEVVFTKFYNTFKASRGLIANQNTNFLNPFPNAIADAPILLGPFFPAPTTSVTEQVNAIIQYMKSQNQQLLSPPMAVVTNPNLSLLQTDFTQNNFLSFIDQVIPEDCSENDRLQVNHNYAYSFHEYTAKFLSLEWHEDAPIARSINEELNKGVTKAMPVSIEYCSTVLDAGKSFKEIMSSYDPNCGPHASLVIGRRFNAAKNSCEFLVRNTWFQADPYSNDWEREANKDQIWIEANTLIKAVYRTTKIGPNFFDIAI